MAMRDMTRLDVMQFIEDAFPGKQQKLANGKVVDVPSTRTQNVRDKVFNLFEGQAVGSTKSTANTPYQMFQAVTQFIDRDRSVRKNTNRWEASVFGSGQKLRQDAFDGLIKFTRGPKSSSYNQIVGG